MADSPPQGEQPHFDELMASKTDMQTAFFLLHINNEDMHSQRLSELLCKVNKVLNFDAHMPAYLFHGILAAAAIGSINNALDSDGAHQPVTLSCFLPSAGRL